MRCSFFPLKKQQKTEYAEDLQLLSLALLSLCGHFSLN